MRKLAALTQWSSYPEYRQTTSVRKTCFTSKGTDHISIISHPQLALTADEPMASVHLRQWARDGLGDTESWGWNLVLQVKGPLCVCNRVLDRACGY